MLELIKNKKNSICKIIDDGKEVKIKIKCRIPFGLEYYNKNKIINLSVLDKNNDEYNSIQEFMALEKKIMELFPKEQKESRTFISGIRNLDEKIGQKIIKTYMSRKRNEQFILSPELIKTKNILEAEIRFDSVWMSLTSYGIMINILDVYKI